jgi:hypothetical protein
LEGEVGEVVGGEPKTLLRWIGPQHADDDVIREASDENLACRSPREDIGTRRSGEGAPDDGQGRLCDFEDPRATRTLCAL